MKTSIILFFHKKSVMHQQNTTNEEDKVIRKKYVLNKTKQWFDVSTAWLLRKRVSWVVEPRGWAISSRSFEETYRLNPQGYESIHGFITLKLKSFKTSESNYQSHGKTTHNTSFLIRKQVGNKLDLEALCHFQRVARQACRYTNLSIAAVFSLSLSLVTQPTWR